MQHLVLFDIDGTLISVDGAGMGAMDDAGRELFGEAFNTQGVQYAGRLDPLIVSDILRKGGAPVTPLAVDTFLERYAHHLERRLAQADRRALHGALQLVESLAKEQERFIVGVLTGNHPTTGSLKLRACGFDTELFRVCAWGTESLSDPPTREDLVLVALDRCTQQLGVTVAAQRVTVIGDTVHDVACGKAHGARVIAVTTGRYTEDQLRRAGADLVLESLQDAATIREWILSV